MATSRLARRLLHAMINWYCRWGRLFIGWGKRTAAQGLDPSAAGTGSPAYSSIRIK